MSGAESAPLEASIMNNNNNNTSATAPPRSKFLRALSCCCNMLGSAQAIVICVLALVVVVVTLQVQYMNMELEQVQEEMKQLHDSLHNQTQGQIAELSDKVDQEHSLTLYQMAGTFSMLTCLLTMFHMSSHLRNFEEPLIQRKIVALLWMSPIYSVTSFLSLVFPSANGYLAIIKDFYEAYAIFTFLSFLIAVLGRGDRQAAVDTLSIDASHLRQPTRWLRTWYHPPPETSNTAKANAVITECTILCMQYVFVRPITSVVSFAATTLVEMQFADDVSSSTSSSNNNNNQWEYFSSPAFYCDMIVNFSIILAFNGLLKFYHAVDKQLAWCQPLQKFLTVKAVVFLTFWQGLLIDILVQLNNNTALSDDGTKTDVNGQLKASQIQNFLICLEMLFFSIAHWCVFPVEEWEAEYRPKKYEKPGIGLKDFVQDVGYIMSSRSDARRYRKRANSVASDSDSLELQEEGLERQDYVDVDRSDALALSEHHDII